MVCVSIVLKIQGVQVRDPTNRRLGRVGGRSQPGSPTEIAARWGLEDWQRAGRAGRGNGGMG